MINVNVDIFNMLIIKLPLNIYRQKKTKYLYKDV